MIVRHLHNVHELLSVLTQPTDEMRHLRELLCEQGRFPARRTWKRRLKALPGTLPAQIGCLGRHLIDLIEPWATCGRAVAIFPKSGWQALVYGWKLHVVCVVAAVWFPIAAMFTPANVADSEPAPALLREVPADVRFVLGGSPLQHAGSP
ncbi:MAG TPA: hypothetical protein VF043_05305 [Ktedonobacteraceae bacterium]